jgi:uncharacterized protein with PIN domain
MPDGAWYDAIRMHDAGPRARFVVDTMLGRLARWLRAMGFDTLYPGQVEDHRLLHLAHAEDRVLVTRDRRLARLAHPRGCLIRSEMVDHQIAEMRERLGLAPPVSAWLTRCLDCNTPLEPRDRADLSGLVPPHVFDTHAAFMACPGCGKIYWPGTHVDRMLARLERLLGGESR